MNNNITLKMISKEEAVIRLAPTIAKCYQLCGQYFKPDHPLDVFTADFYEMTKMQHPAVTVETIQMALLKGITGAYGDFVGLSVVNMVRFVTEHLKPKTPQVNCQQTDEGEEPKLLERNKFTDSCSFIATMYDIYKSNKTADYLGGWDMAHAFMRENNLFDDTNAVPVDDVIDRLCGELLQKRTLLNKIEINERVMAMRRERDAHQDVSNEMHKLSVLRQFDSWILRGYSKIQVTGIIEERRPA